MSRAEVSRRGRHAVCVAAVTNRTGIRVERDPSAFESFVADLNRRRVVRVVVIYAAVIFAVLQAADIVLPALGLPDALMRLIVITTLVGLPIAVAGSWLFDITSEGIVRTAGIRGEPPPPMQTMG